MQNNKNYTEKIFNNVQQNAVIISNFILQIQYKPILNKVAC